MPSDSIAIEGSNVEFLCRASDRKVDILWLNDGQNILLSRKNDLKNRILVLNNGDLLIRQVQIEDEGFYVCSISDSRESKFAQAQLTVKGFSIFFYFSFDKDIFY
jgi:hypothetical protein